MPATAFRQNGNYYPQIAGKVEREVEQAIRTAYDKIYGLTGRIAKQESVDFVTRAEAIKYLGPAAQRQNLQAGGVAPLNVQGLIGQLAQPQIADAESVTALPPITSPLSQDGVLVSLNDQVYRFDGTTDPGTWKAITAATTYTLVDNEVPAGTVDGTNKTFTLAASPNPSTSLHLFLNGVRQTPTTDYSISGSTITMVAAPGIGSTLLADYRK